MYLLKNCNLIAELTEGGLEKGDILVRNDQIESVEQTISSTSNTEVIDMTGKWVLPGLIDLHTHLDCEGIEFSEENLLSDAYRGLKSAYFARQTLLAGFTTLRDVGARNLNDIYLRDAINRGYVIGPRMLVSGRVLTPTAVGNEELPGEYREADGCEEIRKAVREQVAAGANLIKYMGTGAMGHYGSNIGASLYTLEEVQAMVHEASRHNLHVAVHAHGTEGILYALLAGVRTIEHASMLDDKCIELLKQEKSFIVPTLSAAGELIHNNEIQGRKALSMQRKNKENLEMILHSISKAYKAGLKMGYGTDKGTSYNWHGQNYNELKYRQMYLGMQPMELLLQATRYSAEIIFMEDKIGSIHVGKFADLIAVNENPLHDISCLCRNPCYVMKEGQVIHCKL